MKAMLRRIARRFADPIWIDSAYEWQHRCIRAEAAVERQAQSMRGELEQKEDQIQRQANLFEQLRDQADALRRRVTELEQAAVAPSATSGLDTAWLDVAAVSGPQSKPNGRQ